MPPELIRKLKDELVQPIASERQVAYILVELRKLLDLNGDADKFFALNFYCDWAVHPVMYRKGAAKIVERVDMYQELVEKMKDTKPGEYLGADLSFLGPLGEALRLEKFRTQFGEYIRAHVLGYDIAAGEGWWTNFLAYYALVIQDCPLRCTSSNLKFADEVVLRVIDVHPPGTHEYTLVIEWSWISKIDGMETKNQQFF